MERMIVEAKCVAAFADALLALPHETYATVTATENGKPWAVVDVSPMTDTARSAFPNYAEGFRGDTRKRGQSGVMFRSDNTGAVRLVVDRARRMFNA